MTQIKANTIVAVFSNDTCEFSYFRLIKTEVVPQFNPNYDHFEAEKSAVSIAAMLRIHANKEVESLLTISESTEYVVLDTQTFHNIVSTSNNWQEVDKKVLQITNTNNYHGFCVPSK